MKVPARFRAQSGIIRLWSKDQNNQTTDQARRPFAKATLNRPGNGRRKNGKNMSC